MWADWSVRIGRRWLSTIAFAMGIGALIGSAAALCAPFSDEPVVTIREVPRQGSHPTPPARTRKKRVHSRTAGYRAQLRATAPAQSPPNVTVPGLAASDSRPFARPTRRRASRPHLRSESAEALNLRAYRLLQQDRYEDAEPLLWRALKARPDFPYAQYNLGWSLVGQGKAKQAVRVLEHAIRQQPDRWEPYERLGDAYSMLGDTDRADDLYRQSWERREGRRSKPEEYHDRDE